MDVDTINSRRGTVAFCRAGRGPTVVLLHGLPGSRRSWDRVVDLLVGTHDVIVPDLLGFGDSAMPSRLDEVHAAAQAEAVLDLLDALSVDTAVLVGHDFGGPVALAVLALAPERVSGLGLLATNAFVDTPVPVPLNVVTWPIVGGAAARLLFSRLSLRLMLRSGVGTPKTVLPVDVYLGASTQRRTIATIFRGSLQQLEHLYAPIQTALEQAAVPGMVLWGDRDPFFSVEQGRRTATAYGAPFVALPGAGHFLPAERPTEVAAAISELSSAATSPARGGA